tara:strand:- start:345 stop:533 length:189 start_codon:yes stop_codon:yes gene_type:complete
MSNHKRIMEDSAAFFNKEVDKVILKVTTAKTEKSRLKYLKQMLALKNRLSLEVKMLNDLDNF